MSFEKKIQKQLDKHDQQWENAICPDVTKYGKQADLRISDLSKKLSQSIDLLSIEDRAKLLAIWASN